MPNTEAAAIQAAYEAEIQALFKTLILGLSDAGATLEADQQCLERFTIGLNLTQRARTLALSVVAPAEAAPAKTTTADAQS